MGLPKVEISSEHKEVIRPVMMAFTQAKEKFKYAHAAFLKELNSLNETSKLIGGAMGLDMATAYVYDPIANAFRDRLEVAAEDAKLLEPPAPFVLPPTTAVKAPIINIPGAPAVPKPDQADTSTLAEG